jgi:hypothetical protein
MDWVGQLWLFFLFLLFLVFLPFGDLSMELLGFAGEQLLYEPFFASMVDSTDVCI